MNKFDPTSHNITDEKKAGLKNLFPEAFTEQGIDFDRLKTLLGEVVEDESERYSFTWPGKSDAIRASQISSMGTLSPNKEFSVDWETTKNLYLEGDNLEVLKLLQKSYTGKVKMIYIDPPYNTGKDFVYPDNYGEGLKTYLEYTGQVDGEGRKLSTNTETSGRYHSKWLNMMYPRLILARNLLKDDGAIFISIDDHEATNLRKICDEIFGEENFVNSLIARRRIKSLNVQFADKGLSSFNVGFEYILVYAKKSSFVMKALRMNKQNVPTKGTWNVFWSGADRPTMRYELLGFTPESGQWRWSKEKANEAINNYEVFLKNFSERMSLEDYWISTGENLKFIRRIPDGQGKNGGIQYWIGPTDSSLRTSNWTDIEASEIGKEFDLPFDNPKSKKLIETIISTCDEKDFIILDFFAGSSTTAHAVMSLNAQDGGNRKFILSQLPESTPEDSEARKAGYKNIAEIGKERIRLAGVKIRDEYADKIKERETPLDTGFKIYDLTASTFNVWDVKNKDDIQQKLIGATSLIKDNAKEEDILSELILKSGYGLTEKVETFTILGKNFFSIASGSLIISLETGLTLDVVRQLAEKKPSQFVAREHGFGSDDMLTNIAQIMKDKGIDFRIL